MTFFHLVVLPLVIIFFVLVLIVASIVSLFVKAVLKTEDKIERLKE